MALKLTLDFEGVTVAELLRFADTIRASDIAAETTLDLIDSDYDGHVSIPTGLSVVVSAEALGSDG